MREDRTPQEIQEYADTLLRLGNQIQKIVTAMKDVELPTLLVHGDSAVNRYLPALRKWASSLEVDCELQIRAYKKGVASLARKIKDRNAPESKKKPGGK